MTKEIFARNGSWILEVIRDKCELTQAETDYLDFLIEVLEQEPCEDCISRADLEEMEEPMYDPAGKMIGFGVLMKWVKDMPSIQPKAKTAHWQNNACSNCGIYNASAYKNWCPNCGCQMTEETE